MPLPTKMRAIVEDAEGKPQVAEDVVVPVLSPGDVLVKTSAVALNPSDFKMGASLPTPGAIVGMDFAGTVVAVAPGTETTLAPGDAVCSAVYGSNPVIPDNGAFAQFVRVPADILMRIDQDPTTSQPILSPTHAATLGTAIATCQLALWGPDALNIPFTPDRPASQAESFSVLVYGGSTATGTIAIQLLRLSGLDPIATCSPHNFDLVRSCGASAVFDYRSASAEEVGAGIRTYTRNGLRFALDCISDPESTACCYAAIQRYGGRYVCLEMLPEELLKRRRAVKGAFVFAAEALGEEVRLAGGFHLPAKRETREMTVERFEMCQRLVNGGRLKAHPPLVVEGGLDGIVEGLAVLKSGGVSGRKLVAVLE